MVALLLFVFIAGCATSPPRNNVFVYHGHKTEPGEIKQVGVTGEPGAAKLFLELLNATQPGVAMAVMEDGQFPLNNPHDIDQATWDKPGNGAFTALMQAQSTDQLSALLLVVPLEQNLVTGQEESGVGKAVGLFVGDLAVGLATKGGHGNLSNTFGGSSVDKVFTCPAKGVAVFVVKQGEVRNKIRAIECQESGSDPAKTAISKAIDVLLKGQYPENTEFFN